VKFLEILNFGKMFRNGKIAGYIGKKSVSNAPEIVAYRGAEIS